MDSLTSRFQKEVFEPYVEFLKAEYRFHRTFSHAKATWERKLTPSELINGPYLEKSLTYDTDKALENLRLLDKTLATVRNRLRDRDLWRHQTAALELLLAGENAVIATGTSSGKTLCYQLPILDDLLRDSSPGLRAIIIYPLNALVNDQLSEWEEILKEHPAITYARFTGQTPANQQKYEATLRETFRLELGEQQRDPQELQIAVERKVAERLESNPANRLNHREEIRAQPPHVLITNFSMLEYLLERPIDAPIFERSRLRFLVLDEVHAYRGIQATEIAFLVRRLKDRLALDQIQCIATSATLGKPGESASEEKVREFVTNLFGEPFHGPKNPIYGKPASPALEEPAFYPTPEHYIAVAEELRNSPKANLSRLCGTEQAPTSLPELLKRDGNLARLRREILTEPTKLSEAARRLWPENARAEQGLEAFLEIVAVAKKDGPAEDILPTRLHYFIRAQDGLHVCLHRSCPGRHAGKPAFFVSRKGGEALQEGDCPDCDKVGLQSRLVEVVSCRKCGYLYGALQDLGPRRAQNPSRSDNDPKAYFDSFSTELGWASDSYWSYFSVDEDLPYPVHRHVQEDDEEPGSLLDKPAEIEWCVQCGKKKMGAGEICRCPRPHLRKIQIFHRQCPTTGKPRDRENLLSHEKALLGTCPNCGARNVSGIEPVQRFQESDDEMGLAMAVPLAHFQISASPSGKNRRPRKLLCFTDNRQRAAAFPSLLEEETFARDMGRKIVEIVRAAGQPISIEALGDALANAADPNLADFDPEFFLPISRYPDQDPPDPKAKRDLWVAETFSYFGIPDSARESAEDFGLVAVRCALTNAQLADLAKIFAPLRVDETGANTILQVLLAYARKRKAFTLPHGRVTADALAFGRVRAAISLVRELGDVKNDDDKKTVVGWLPARKDNAPPRDNAFSDYLARCLDLGAEPEKVREIGSQLWDFLTSSALLIRGKESWALGHQKLFIVDGAKRYVCDRCGEITAYSFRSCCPRKACGGSLQSKPFDPKSENIVAHWVSGAAEFRFATLKSEEHTAQINRELAKRIEDRFRGEVKDESRIEGVNVLSSTTTFEMGINIGDLQKILLRNAPPSSANYIQRVGRAGRGEEKNSISVTLCRRTKYDADSWENPLRLMSGVIRSPTVYLTNRVIAQRHFNALVFAAFLRQRLREQRALGVVQQKIRLEAFLPLDSRAGIPDGWFDHNSLGKYLDFVEWLAHQTESALVQTSSGRALVEATSGWDTSKDAASKEYRNTLENISEELVALMNEREQLHKAGLTNRRDDAEQSVKNLLASDLISVLAKRGFLPRYAFPLDVVTLETGRTRWSGDSDVELSRDRGIAIAEFAPGAQVVAHKKVFTSAGLYIVSDKDKPDRRFYSRCAGCNQVRVGRRDTELLGPCKVCGRDIHSNDVQLYVSPTAFSIRIDEKQRAPRFRRSTLIRQRQTLTHFIDHVDPTTLRDAGPFRIAWKKSGSLFRYNLGPGGEGFTLCNVCGCSEPRHKLKAGRPHKRLRSSTGSMVCRNENLWAKRIAFAHEFQSFCLVVRPTKPVDSIVSLAFALQLGVCKVLQVEPSDIGVSWRDVGGNEGPSSSEIVLYDQVPGGAGFAKEASENWSQVMNEALGLCKNCGCKAACYDCLKGYGNQAHHDNLNRYQVIEFFSTD